MTTELAPKYAPADVEPAVNRSWNDAGTFDADPNAPGAPYAIVIPPPNVTSALHMGHALNNTLQDILVRYRRMEGRNTLWMPGTDHAGIATQTVVEKRLAQQEGKRRTDFNRASFVARIEAWKDEYEQRITDQLKAMGCSCDWRRQRFTMDPMCTAAVREAFFRLFRDGLIYRGKRLVNWDPATQTALADDEVEMHEVEGSFWYLRYPVVDGGAGAPDHVTVATTRPETMLGDTAVAMHPDDPRASDLVGRHICLPIVNRVIPIVTDDYVVPADPESSDEKARYSSGFLKITPAHDANDWDVWQRHQDAIPLGAINVMAPDGTISADHGWPAEEFESGQAEDARALLGLSREAARDAVVTWFRSHNLLEDVRPYRHAVGHSYRSHVPIEPYLSDQWYVRVTDDRLKGAALRALKKEQIETADTATKRGAGTEAAWEGGLRFHPARYARTFQLWHENIRDWCISRQLWWGHRIPVWSTDADVPLDRWRADKEVAVATFGDRTYICLRCDDATYIADLEAAGFEQDEDVLDTWFSSALWPISTMGWPDEDNNAVLQRWNPSDTLCTAREIITLWVSRMVMFNLYFRDCLPFRDVFIHAMIQDGHGQKMSKSLGNGVDPFDIIHSHGADAMRFTLAAMTTQTQDVRLPVDAVCPHTGTIFTPSFVDDGTGHQVAAPELQSPADRSKRMVSSYGLASGKAVPTKTVPLARNTSAKFDLGRNFANKLWNAVRFAIGHLETSDGTAPGASDEPAPLADRWIVTRLQQTITETQRCLETFEFKTYADGLYDFIWRDLCDWYIEAVKPTVRTDARQRHVLATALDVALRLLHPVMPYITERLWDKLNEVAPERGVAGITLPGSRLLAMARWPTIDASHLDAEAVADFEQVRNIVAAIRKVRTTYKVPPRQALDASIATKASQIVRHADLVKALAGLSQFHLADGADDDAVATTVGDVTIHLHGLVDRDEERRRLSKHLEEIEKDVRTLAGRLNNRGYVDKAPSHLVEQTREQLAAAEKESEGLRAQLRALE